MKNRIFAFMLIAWLLLGIAPTFAQDETPEVTEAPTVTASPVPEPTAVVTPTPVIDEAQIPSWLFVLGLVFVAGFVAVAWVGIVNAAKGMPEWAKELLIGSAKSGVNSLDQYAKTTDNLIDDAAVAELRRRVTELEAALSVVQQKVQ